MERTQMSWAAAQQVIRDAEVETGLKAINDGIYTRVGDRLFRYEGEVDAEDGYLVIEKRQSALK